MMNIAVCKCCDGSGVQVKLDGIKIYCPACAGTGESPLINQNIKNFPKLPDSNLLDERKYC